MYVNACNWMAAVCAAAPLDLANQEKLKSFLLLDVHWKRQICPHSPCLADLINHLNFQSNTDSGGYAWESLGFAFTT